MRMYLYAIKMGFLIFPILAVMITLPYIIYQYRKYGSILFLKSVILYSFVLYLLIIYFLVILPLPPIEEVKEYIGPYVQLKPLYSFFYLKKNIVFSITDFTTYRNLICNSYFYQVIYNILITIPFGIYLKYYFRCDFKRTICFTFILSLFLELTQLTGLYGIYPRPYRIFDVDDFITNVLGGGIGYLITPLICLVLPSREKLDEQAYLRGKKVSLFRRLIAFFIDGICIVCLLFLVRMMTGKTIFIKDFSILFLLTWIFYFLLLSCLFNGKTVGRICVNIALASKEGTLKKIQIFVREFLFSVLLVIWFPIFYAIFYQRISKLSFFLATTLVLIQIFYYFLFRAKKKDIYVYEKISKTHYVSTIYAKIENEKNEKIESQNEEENKAKEEVL